MISKESIQIEIHKLIDRRLSLGLDEQVERLVSLSSRNEVCKQVLGRTWGEVRSDAEELKQQIKNVIATQIIEDIKNGK